MVLVTGAVMAIQDKKEDTKIEKKKETRAELKERLTPEQWHVTQEEGTEPPFKNEYWDNKEEGIYVDIVDGEPLFSSTDKYKSGSGWPSFTRAIDDNFIEQTTDYKLVYPRTELKGKASGSHLGHVFSDGPQPTGKRFCINSASLRFVAVKDLDKDPRYKKYKSLFAKQSINPNIKKALLAGGCFWGVEELIRTLKGVADVEVGYAGGDVENATYVNVKTGQSGHAESVLITYDQSIISYEDILNFFFRLHDPTTLNRQGNDVGTQYRSVIFYYDKEQKEAAQKVKDLVNKSGKWKKPVVTAIEPYKNYFKAEDFHQDYLQKHPGGYTCHFLRD